ncbi:hypothetical protein AHAS_Ahas03G0218900 [Arachis hypogaea]
MEVNGGKGLMSVMVQSYVVRMVCRHGMGLVGSYKVVHHIFQLGLHCRMVVVHDILEGVVA